MKELEQVVKVIEEALDAAKIPYKNVAYNSPENTLGGLESIVEVLVDVDWLRSASDE